MAKGQAAANSSSVKPVEYHGADQHVVFTLNGILLCDNFNIAVFHLLMDRIH